MSFCFVLLWKWVYRTSQSRISLFIPFIHRPVLKNCHLDYIPASDRGNVKEKTWWELNNIYNPVPSTVYDTKTWDTHMAASWSGQFTDVTFTSWQWGWLVSILEELSLIFSFQHSTITLLSIINYNFEFSVHQHKRTLPSVCLTMQVQILTSFMVADIGETSLNLEDMQQTASLWLLK